MAFRIACGIFCLVLACQNPAHADEQYFVMVFGSQLERPNPDYSHSWAVFVKATPFVQDGKPAFHLDHHTLSWLPQTLKVKVDKLLPEPGVNLGLHATCRWCLDNGMRISMWGPYQIEPALYAKSLEQLALLNSGQVRYKAADTGFPTNRVSNCIHGVTHTIERDRVRLRVASPGWGQTASHYITRRLEPWLMNPDQRHEWVALGLGLDRYPIIHRDLRENPRTGAGWSAVRRVFGGDPVGRGALTTWPGSPP